jgi:hypothetical protein
VKVRAEKAKLRHLRDQLGGESRIAVAIADEGENSLLCESARSGAHHQFVFIEERIDTKIVHTTERHCDSTYLNI